VRDPAPDAPSLAEQALFFRLVVKFTPENLRLLVFLDNAGAFFSTSED
jgi:hypothetical protein